MPSVRTFDFKYSSASSIGIKSTSIPFGKSPQIKLRALKYFSVFRPDTAISTSEYSVNSSPLSSEPIR